MQRQFLTSTLILTGAAMIGGCQAMHHPWLSGQTGQSSTSSGAMVNQVDLFPNGMGYIGYRAVVDNTKTLHVAINQNQVNDLLKTIVFFDSSNSPPELTFNTPIPLSVKLANLPLAPTSGGSWISLLEQLKGRRVSLKLKNGKCVSGRLISIKFQWPIFPMHHPVPEPLLQNGQPAMFPLSRFAEIYHHGRVERVALADMLSFQVRNRQLRASLRRALRYIADNRRTGSADIAIEFRGHGRRKVQFGYATQTPLWRMTYRLLLPALSAPQRDTKAARLLADVIVHNTTSTPWRDITLQINGSWPKSFIEDLQQPLYGRRHVLPLPADTALTPQSGLFYLQSNQLASNERKAALPIYSRLPPAADAFAIHAYAARALMPRLGLARNAAAVAITPSIDVSTMAAPQTSNPAFNFVAQNISISSEKSASFPVFSAPVSAYVVSTFNVNERKTHLRRAVLIFNNSKHYLPAGPMTVFQGGAYTGEISAPAIPVHSRHVLPYAVDLAATAEIQPWETSTFDSAALNQGNLYLNYAVTKRTNITINSLHHHPITVVARFGPEIGWKFTLSHFKAIRLTHGTGVEIPVTPMSDKSYLITRLAKRQQQVNLHTAGANYLASLLTLKGLERPVAAALRHIIRLKKDFNAANLRVAEIGNRIAELNTDENRIRQNLAAAKSVPAQAQHFARALVALDKQIRSQQHAQRDAKAAARRAQKSLDRYIRHLK
ncbi:MAG: hypothetical protein ACP5O1_02995 [Phycisphaerae bacterium]